MFLFGDSIKRMVCCVLISTTLEIQLINLIDLSILCFYWLFRNEKFG